MQKAAKLNKQKHQEEIVKFLSTEIGHHMFEYETESSRDCDSYGCQGICRCERIDVVTLEELDASYEINFINHDLSDEENDKVLEILRENNVFDRDYYDVVFDRDYYGEVVSSFEFAGNVKEIKRELKLALEQ